MFMVDTFLIISVLYPGLCRKAVHVPLPKKKKKQRQIAPYTHGVSIVLLEHHFEKSDFDNLSESSCV